MDFNLRVWRQTSPDVRGEFCNYPAHDISPDASFIEMLDQVNRDLVSRGTDPIAFDCDCLEGICGSCSLMINGIAHGPERGVTTCQTYMRSFEEGSTILVEPWRSRAFPVIRDLVTDRSAFDRIVQAGGFVSVRTGSAPDGNTILVPKDRAETAMDAAECIGCGACVASCKNGSAALFVAAKVSHLALLPQGDPERAERVRSMVEAMDREGFGACTNQYECEAVCPKEISVKFIAKMYREYMRAGLTSHRRCHQQAKSICSKNGPKRSFDKKFTAIQTDRYQKK